MDCIFCRILKGEVKAEILAENDSFFCIKDINPKSRVHILIISKEHKSNFIDYFGSHDIADLVEIIKIIKDKFSLENGYKIVTNTGKDGGQSIDHFHVHILGGEPIEWTV